MALEDIASMRAVYGSSVLYPSDANQAAALVAKVLHREGIVFIRTTREKLPVIYPSTEPFDIGGSRVVRQTDADQVTLVGAGITLHESIAAADLLKADGISARVIDCFSVKPIDADTLRAAGAETAGIITVEDHWPEGGLGDAVLEALADADDRGKVVKLAVREMPVSGSPEELLHAAGIDAEAIAAAARQVVGARA
jgi:transketolase